MDLSGRSLSEIGERNPIPFLRKDDREDLRQATGDTTLPALKLADGTVLRPSKEIMTWVKAQP